MNAKKMVLLVCFSAVMFGETFGGRSPFEKLFDEFEKLVKCSQNYEQFKKDHTKLFNTLQTTFDQKLEQLKSGQVQSLNLLNEQQDKLKKIDVEKVSADKFELFKKDYANNVEMLQQKVGMLDQQKIAGDKFEQFRNEQNQQILKLFDEQGTTLGAMQKQFGEQKLAQEEFKQFKNAQTNKSESSEKKVAKLEQGQSTSNKNFEQFKKDHTNKFNTLQTKFDQKLEQLTSGQAQSLNLLNEQQEKLKKIDVEKVSADKFELFKKDYANNVEMLQQKVGMLDQQEIAGDKFEQFRNEQNQQILKLFDEQGTTLGAMQKQFGEQKLAQEEFKQFKNAQTNKSESFEKKVEKLEQGQSTSNKNFEQFKKDHTNTFNTLQTKFDQKLEQLKSGQEQSLNLLYESLVQKIEGLTSASGKSPGDAVNGTQGEELLEFKSRLFDMQKMVERISGNQITLKMKIEQLCDSLEQEEPQQERQEEPIINQSLMQKPFGLLDGSDKGVLNNVISMLLAQKKRIDEFATEKKKKIDVLDIFDRLDEQDEEDGNTAMHRAVEKNKPALVQGLIGLGAAINLKNKLFYTPLQMAVLHGFAAIIKLLLNADKNMINEVDENGNSVVHLACLASNSDEALSALLTAPIDLNIQNKFGDTPLHVASICQNYKAAKLLVQKGANKFLQNNVGKTPLMIAEEKNSKKIMNILGI